MPRRPTRYYPDYGPLLPTSGPDWRWARALEIISSGKNASLERDGPDIVRAIGFIRKTCEVVTAKPMRRLFKDDPDLALAYRFANEGGHRELELQCRILARESSGVIAVEMGLTKSIVETYCLMFFDVTERLKARGFILHRVIQIPLAAPMAPETLMLLCAYNHGPLVIEPWLDYLEHQCEAHDLNTPQGRLRESMELLVTAHGLALDAETHLSLVKHGNLIFQTRPNMFRQRSVEQVFSENVSRRLDETLWRQPENGVVEKVRKRKSSTVSSKRTPKLKIA
ncbi:MAG: hypothetical protein V4719_28360 [Planctomycetota bacterium]